MKKKRLNISSILLVLTIISYEKFAYLIPYESFIIPGLLRFSDLGLVFGTCFIFWVYFCTKGEKRIKYNYKYIVCMYVLIIVISSYKANQYFGQPMFMGIRATRLQLMAMVLYFPITKAIQTGLIKRNDLLNIMYTIATIELIVYSLQFVLVNFMKFTYIDTSEIRGTSARLRFSYILPLVMGMISLGRAMDSNSKHKCLNLLYFIWSAFLLIGICKHRAPSIVLIATCIVAYIIWKKNISEKIIYGILCFTICFSFVINLDIVQLTIESLTNKSSMNNTLDIRKAGQEYYKEKLKESPIFGYGWPNSQWKRAVYGSGQQYYYYIEDNGIYGFAYMYGLAGVLLIILLYFKNIKKSIKLYSLNGNAGFLLYNIFEVGNLYIGLHWYYHYYIIPFILMFCLLEYECKEKKGEKENESLRFNCNI